MTSVSQAPSVSVVMATYNGTRYLPQQIRSVLDQLVEADELVIVDDCSRDDTVALIESIGSSRIRLYRNDRNQGVFHSFERALSLSQGEVVFLCDQDDVWLPGKRQAFVDAFVRDPAALIVLSDAQVIDAQSNVTITSFMATRGGFQGSLWSTLARNRYLGCTMALRRSLLHRVVPIPRNVPMHDMWIGALGTIFGHVVYLEKPYLQYRRHGGNVSPSTPQSLWRMLRWRVTLAYLLLVRWSSVKIAGASR
ncbi:glycosyltransferase family 2 protein [uncultured Sphaerotilus sp.]|uniref:glycosyltransferase family 2 protein n=1 Tax=uncultured Sphaerotilus sp. TaxID=474984 RepID=UPI0030CA1EC7